MHEDDGDVAGNRALMALIGAVAGLALWFLADKLPDMLDNERVVLAVVSFSAAFFAIALAANGPVKLARAAGLAAGLAGLAAVLLTWASLRFSDVGDFLSTGYGLAAWALIVSIPVPFLIAHLRAGERWRDYPALFDHAWQIVVRYLVAWAFVGIFWAVLLLSDQVLKIVGLRVIEDLLDFDPVPFTLTGLVLGLGLAVVHELRAYVSPFLALRLLRLLLPLVLVVSAVFLLAAPIKGLSNLFGGISAAATLMALALAAITLITTALDASDEEAAQAPVLIWSARIMAGLTPLLAGLAAWAVWLRVAQYGWTPDRLLAAIAAGVLLAYGLAYAASLVRGAAWRNTIRASNVTMALVSVGLAALLLTPVLNPERISANSQVARFGAGLTDVDDLDLWAIGREWGRPGRAALDRLAQIDTGADGALSVRLARLDAADSRREFERGNGAVRAPEALRSEFLDLLIVRPEGASLPPRAFAASDLSGDWLPACRRKTAAGAPGCVAVVGDFSDDSAGDEAVLFFLTSWGSVEIVPWRSDGRANTLMLSGRANLPTPALIDRLVAGDYTFGPVTRNALRIGDLVLGVGP